MFISANSLPIPRFSGSYLERHRAIETSKDTSKEILELGYGEDSFYINNDHSGRDLDQFKELTEHMFQYDPAIPPTKQDLGLSWRDLALLNRRLSHLHVTALENYAAEHLQS